MSLGSPRRALVTGASGFLGRHLVGLLLQEDYQVAVTSKTNLKALAGLPVTSLPCDIRDADALALLLKQTAPQVVFHLAGLARGDDLAELLTINVSGTRALLEAAGQLREPPRVVIPGSAAEYGVQSDTAPIHETAVLRPLGAYGVSKAAQTLLGQSYALRGRLSVIIGRVFNIVGPGEPEAMLCGAIAAQVAGIEAGRHSPVVRVGNLSPVRDYVDVRDAARALLLLADRGESGSIYNICSGKPHRVEDVVQRLTRLSSVDISLTSDPDRQRPADIPYCLGDPSRIQITTGWRPRIAIEDSLRATLKWWRQQHAHAPSILR